MISSVRQDPTTLPRVLAGIDPSGRPLSLDEHERLNGPMPTVAAARLIEEVRRSGLRGRGGADFPTARKLAAVAGRGRASAVIVNGSETEPASRKDVVLMSCLPHLVLDGALLAARAVGAKEVIVAVRASAEGACRAMREAAAERDERIAISVVPGGGGYVSGEETAVINRLAGGRAAPRFVPPRPYERGYRRAPTLVDNVETLAQLALIARFGAVWFRSLGTDADPGTVLATVSGAVAAPGVYELAFGTSLGELIDAAGGAIEPIRAYLIGGYFGSWVPADRAATLRLSRQQLAPAGAALGTGVVIALGASACGLHETARLVRYLAGESAGQCGPCVYGLGALADSLGALSDGRARRGERERILRWCGEIRGRGACHHPDGVVRLVASALATFAPELAGHEHGRCGGRPPMLPLGNGAGRSAALGSADERRAGAAA